jgi:hypothetical protein
MNERLTMFVRLRVEGDKAYVENEAEWYPVEAFLDPRHDDHMDAIGGIGGDDLMVVPYWPGQDMAFSVDEAYLSEDRTMLHLVIATDLDLDDYVTLVGGE